MSDYSNTQSLGNAVWTANSRVVTFVAQNLNVAFLGEDYPFSDSSNGGGFVFSGKWGQNRAALPPDILEETHGIAASWLNYKAPFASPDPNLRLNAFALRAHGRGFDAYQNSSGMRNVNIMAKFGGSGNSISGLFGISCQSERSNFASDCNSAEDGSPYCVPLPPSDINEWTKFVVQIPLTETIPVFKQLCLFHTTDGLPYTESVVIDSVFMSNDEEGSIKLDDTITVTGDTTDYNIIKMYRNKGTNTITMILDQEYAGTSGTFETFRTMV